MSPRARVWLHSWGVVSVVAFVVLVVCVLITYDGKVPSWELSVFRAINELPDWLETPMVFVQYLGVAVVPFIVAAVAAVLREWRLVIAALLVYPLKLIIEKVILKSIVDRPRPGTSNPDAIVRHAPIEGPSFPSGHAIIAFAVAGIVAPYISRGWRIVAFALAIGVSFSRVYLAAHNPLDVLAGAMAGLILAAGLNLTLGPHVDEPVRAAAPE